MAMTVTFQENQKVTAEDLNAIARDISGAETSFSDGITYGVGDLNDISKEMVTSGVLRGCSVTVKDGVSVHISEGVAFFADGKKAVIDTDGVNLTSEAGAKNYVWLLNDELTGQVSAKCTLSEPTGDCVHLAEITVQGNVKKSSHRALMKNSSLLPNHYGEPIMVEVPKAPTGENYEMEIDIGDSYRKMVAMSDIDMIFLDWENMVYYSDSGALSKRSILDESKPAELTLGTSDSDVVFLSLENNILKVRINPGFVPHSFTIHLM